MSTDAGESQLTRYQPWFDNARRLKDLVAKLEIASVHAVEQAEKHTRGAIPQAQHHRRAPGLNQPALHQAVSVA